MAEIKNSNAYFRKIVRNSYKDEYRANDNYFKHISSVGNEADVQQKSSELKTAPKCDTDCVEGLLSEVSVENWLLFMENERLHKALSALSLSDLELLFILVARGCSHRETAQIYNVTHTSIGKRYRKIILFIRNFLNS